ncbi:Hcp family type VI secretion system effector [Pseudomonas sp. DG56-2]|uniref:Hcp family type VI secretion system effector n=1 Tax=Pseudomonas sp. DG56-2 TaxID=2320270 RepID=UPI0010A5EB57|nr:Hcp family type VI secretion system effector [Pseudomonas sp. DG56-2]
MANVSYMTITGKKQGLISSGCSGTPSIGHKCQIGHENEIMVLSYSHNMTAGNDGGVAGGRGKHMPVVIVKNIDKSTPLLARALNDGEELECRIHFYRASPTGINEKYFTVALEGARVATLNIQIPHAINMNDAEPQEIMSLRYREITWIHHHASTTAHSTWGNENE